MNMVSEPRIWNPGATAISLESKSTSQITRTGKDHNLTCLKPTLSLNLQFKPRLVAPFCDGYTYIPNLTDSHSDISMFRSVIVLGVGKFGAVGSWPGVSGKLFLALASAVGN